MRRRRGGTRDWRRRHGPSPLVQAPGATWPSFVVQPASPRPTRQQWIVVEAVAAAPLLPPFPPPPSAYKYLPSTRAMTSPFTTPAPLFLFFFFSARGFELEEAGSWVGDEDDAQRRSNARGKAAYPSILRMSHGNSGRRSGSPRQMPEVPLRPRGARRPSVPVRWMRR